MRNGFLILALALVLGPRPVAAQSQVVEKQVARMNRAAMDDFDALEFESARKTLVDAVAMLRSSGLDETALAAKTLLNLGILYISGFKDAMRGEQQFVNALKISPDLQLDAALSTPELLQAFESAQKKASAQKPDAAASEPATSGGEHPGELRGLQHEPVDEAGPNAAIQIKVQVGSDVEATRLYLYYRGDGQTDYVVNPMKHLAGSEWVGQVPASATTGRAIQYYLEARDQRLSSEGNVQLHTTIRRS